MLMHQRCMCVDTDRRFVYIVTTNTTIETKIRVKMGVSFPY